MHLQWLRKVVHSKSGNMSIRVMYGAVMFRARLLEEVLNTTLRI